MKVRCFGFNARTFTLDCGLITWTHKVINFAMYQSNVIQVGQVIIGLELTDGALQDLVVVQVAILVG